MFPDRLWPPIGAEPCWLNCFMPVAAAATAAAEIAADADGDGTVRGFTVTTLSSSIACLMEATADEDNVVLDVGFTATAAAAAATSTVHDDGFEAVPVAEKTLFSSEPIDSSLCHLELSAELICVHSSFLQDLDRLMDCSQSLNCALPSGVIWKAFRADKMVLVNSS